MKILVVNCGSSSLKYQLFEMTCPSDSLDEKQTGSNHEKILARGIVERIGEKASDSGNTPRAGKIRCQNEGRPEVLLSVAVPDHSIAMNWVISTLTDPQTGVLGDAKEITAVGHRVVHGGERFAQSVVIDDSVLAAIRDCCQLAPLHNPPNLTGIESCQGLFPNAPQVAVFDTAFFATLPRHAYLYALPLHYYEKFGLRRYGFHGTSHRFVASRLQELNGGRPYRKAITCHLGNGCSMTALVDGVAVENSLGFTPLEGLVMGTRSGDIDPAIVEFLCEREGKTVQEVTQFLNKECGLAGVSGIGNDVRDLLKAAGEGNDQARLALDLFCYRIRKYLGAYTAAMGGLDAVAFTGGIGAHSAPIRKQVCESLSFLGISLDPALNESAQADRLISDSAARVKVFALETNEELMIARDTRSLVSRH